MQSCASQFLGEHDWSAFSATQSDVNDRVRRIVSLNIGAVNDDRACGKMIQIKATANGFLRYMVRSIAGALMAAGRGELSLTEIQDAIDSGNRKSAIVTAPASGLTLASVEY
jgi:tRNA pseudouridine38-40 synthase